MTKKIKVVGKNGVVRHVPVRYNKIGGRAVTIAVSVKEVTAGLLNQRAKDMNITKSKLVDNILSRELDKQ